MKIVSRIRPSRSLLILIGATLAILVAVLGLPASGLNPAGQQTNPPITITNVSDNIYMIKGGSGANCYFLAGKKTNLLVDAKMSPESLKEMLAEIEKISPQPLSLVILTHSDGDHVNGLSGLPGGVRICHKKPMRRCCRLSNRGQNLKTFYPRKLMKALKILILREPSLNSGILVRPIPAATQLSLFPRAKWR